MTSAGSRFAASADWVLQCCTAGVVTVLREARATHAIKLAAIKVQQDLTCRQAFDDAHMLSQCGLLLFVPLFVFAQLSV